MFQYQQLFRVETSETIPVPAKDDGKSGGEKDDWSREERRVGSLAGGGAQLVLIS